MIFVAAWHNKDKISIFAENKRKTMEMKTNRKRNDSILVAAFVLLLASGVVLHLKRHGLLIEPRCHQGCTRRSSICNGSCGGPPLPALPECPAGYGQTLSVVSEDHYFAPLGLCLYGSDRSGQNPQSGEDSLSWCGALLVRHRHVSAGNRASGGWAAVASRKVASLKVWNAIV